MKELPQKTGYEVSISCENVLYMVVQSNGKIKVFKMVDLLIGFMRKRGAQSILVKLQGYENG